MTEEVTKAESVIEGGQQSETESEVASGYN